MANELREELQGELNKLYKSICAAREADFEQTEIEQRTNEFESAWFERLVIEQRAEGRGAREALEAEFQRRADEQQRKKDIQAASQLTGLSAEEQIRHWKDKTGYGRNAFQEQERARETSQAVEKAQTRINDNYAILRSDMLTAIQEIEAGRAPNLSSKLTQQTNKEQRLKNFDEMVKAHQRILNGGFEHDPGHNPKDDPRHNPKNDPERDHEDDPERDR